MELAKVGVLGAGFISSHHIRALQAIRDVRIVAVCDTGYQQAVRTQQQWGIEQGFHSLSDMLQACELDVVHVLLPPPLHAEAAISCMEAGCHVFVEKPAAVSVAECENMRNSAAVLGRTVGVNHNARYHPVFRRLTQEIRKCRLGEIQHVTTFLNVPWRQLSAGQHHHWVFEKPGNIIFEQAPHPLSQILFLLGNTTKTSCLASGRTSLRSGVAFYDTWQISLLCERGSAQCFLSFEKGFSESWFHVIGEDGAALLDLHRNTMRLTEKTRFLEPVDHFLDAIRNGGRMVQDGVRNFWRYAAGFVGLRSPQDPFRISMRDSIGEFYESVHRNASPPVDLEQAQAVIRTCEEIVHSAALV